MNKEKAKKATEVIMMTIKITGSFNYRFDLVNALQAVITTVSECYDIKDLDGKVLEDDILLTEFKEEEE